jgi:hypothetical protein
LDKIKEDKIKIITKIIKEKDQGQDKIDGEEMIDGLEDRLHTKKDHHLVIVEIKIFKHLYHNVKEIKCNSFILFSFIIL